MHDHEHGASNDLRLAFFLNIGFTIFEIVGALLTNSLLLLSDAVHDLGDSLSLGLAWFLERYAGRGSDERYSYGYRRFSLLGALINTIILTLGAIFVISRAIPRLLEPEPVEAGGLVLFAIAGVLINGYAVLRLRSRSGMNARTVTLHLLEDVLGWIAVLVVSIAILIDPRATFLDPLLSIVISLIVLVNVVRNMRRTITLFLQGTPDQIDLVWLNDELRGIVGVESVHHTHVWSLDGENHVLTSHVVVAENASKQEAYAVKLSVREVLGVLKLAHCTVEIEFGDNDCGLQG